MSLIFVRHIWITCEMTLDPTNGWGELEWTFISRHGSYSVYDLYTFFWLIGFGIICEHRKWTCNWFFQIRGEGHVYTCRLASRLIFKDAFKDIYTCIMHVLVRSFSWFSVFEDREFVPSSVCRRHFDDKGRHFCEFFFRTTRLCLPHPSPSGAEKVKSYGHLDFINDGQPAG